MNDHEIQGYLILYGIVAVVGTFMWFVGVRGERKYREHQRKLHAPFNIVMNMGTDETLEETLARRQAFERDVLGRRR